MNIEQEIKNLKKQYNDDKIEKAKCEGRLEDLEKKRVDIVQRCKDAGVEPDELPAKIQESETKLEELINKAKALFNPNEAAATTSGEEPARFDDNAPF